MTSRIVHLSLPFFAAMSSILVGAAEPGFIPLLDKDHMAGWRQSGAGGMRVQDGIATTWTPQAKGVYYGVCWYSERMFSDFILTAEFRATGTAYNSGIRLRFPNPGNEPQKVSEQGYEVSILSPTAPDSSPEMATGAIAHVKAPTAGAALRRDGEWNEIEVSVTGQRYVVKINGRVVNDFTGSKNASGYIGIENHRLGPVQWRNIRVRDLSVPAVVAAGAPAPDPSLPLLDVLAQQAVNATAWVLAPLEESVPGDIRQNLTFLREDLIDEVKKTPKASLEAYELGRQLCNALIATLDERDQTLVKAGYRAAQAEAGTRVTSQALEARRNYQMSWPQFHREQAQRSEISRQQMNAADLRKEQSKVEWAQRTETLRKHLDDLYRRYREALR